MPNMPAALLTVKGLVRKVVAIVNEAYVKVIRPKSARASQGDAVVVDASRDTTSRRAATAHNLNVPISKLPRELLVNIFVEIAPSLVPCAAIREVRQVCKAWNTIVEETPIFWQDIIFSSRRIMMPFPSPNEATPRNYVDQVKLFLKHSCGHIRSLVIQDNALYNEKEVQDMAAVVTLIPWTTLRNLRLDDIAPPCISEKIRLCSGLEQMRISGGNLHRVVKPHDPIASARLDVLMVRFNFFHDADKFFKVNALLLARAKEVVLDLMNIEDMTGNHWVHLDRVIAEVVEADTFERFSMPLFWKDVQSMDMFYPITFEGCIEVRRDAAAQEERMSSNKVSSMLCLKHDLCHPALQGMPAFRAKPVTRLQLHGWTQNSMALLTTLYSNWPHLEHLTIDKCACDEGRPFQPQYNASKGLQQAKDVLDLFTASQPHRLQTVEIQGFSEWTGKGTLSHVANEVAHAIQASASAS